MCVYIMQTIVLGYLGGRGDYHAISSFTNESFESCSILCE